jgi:hypothetical protein
VFELECVVVVDGSVAGVVFVVIVVKIVELDVWVVVIAFEVEPEVAVDVVVVEVCVDVEAVMVEAVVVVTSLEQSLSETPVVLCHMALRVENCWQLASVMFANLLL